MNVGTIIRAKNVVDTANKFYEIGNQSKSYTAVWRHRIYPVYGISLPTFWRYIRIYRRLSQ